MPAWTTKAISTSDDSANSAKRTMTRLTVAWTRLWSTRSAT